MNINPVQLVYIDQNENLSSKDNLKLVQTAIQTQDLNALEETINWYIKAENDNIDSILKEENPELDIDLLFDEDYDGYCNLREGVYERDTSNPLEDLLRNTSEQIFQFRTEYECEAGSWNWNKAQLGEEFTNIKSFLQIPNKVKEHDKALMEMIENADGGLLRIYFITKLDTFLPLNTDEATPPPTTITFSGHVSIGIVDQFNGSGHTVEIDHTFTLPFTYGQLFIDRAVHYNWTDDIAGMVHNWCKGTKFKLA